MGLLAMNTVFMQSKEQIEMRQILQGCLVLYKSIIVEGPNS